MQHTTLEQSRKLISLGVNRETSDLCILESGEVILRPFSNFIAGTPCWSVEPLLGMMPFMLTTHYQVFFFKMYKGLDKNGETYSLQYQDIKSDVVIYSTDFFNSLVDACVDMIEKLVNGNEKLN